MGLLESEWVGLLESGRGCWRVSGWGYLRVGGAAGE